MPSPTLRKAPKEVVFQLVENHYPSDGDIEDRNALYILECRHSSTRNRLKDELTRASESYYDTPPYWVDKAFDADKLYYVGRYSGDVRERIYKHTRGTGANFTGVFPPIEISAIKWIPDSEDTGDREERLGDQIRERCEKDGYDAYVYYY